ncbi:MAG: tetratricopeptide repeat protein, partial [Planctomycetes bacterium]|nr:tetratricopeptide repeat protein [Planctomycetota bacterium]
EESGCDSFDIAMATVEALRLQGELAEAQEKLKRVSRMGDIRAEFHYQLGCLNDDNGRREEAMEEYERAISLDGNHYRALFRLAYAFDLYGDEKQAINYYKRCLESGSVHVSALMNLGVLYEDNGEYYSARDCIKRVLTAYPNHERARLFLKDIESSMTMFYDEELEKRVDYRNQVLQIPISDFELSVRARNCLKKMNIKYLGDLLRVTETELLAYKNFGETSLLEIKVILTQKGLRLGQLLEDSNSRQITVDDAEQNQIDDETMSASVSELQLSVRSRKCLQRLNINSIGELVRCTEAELLGCKNFGLTSLYEIKQRLKDKTLSLRVLQD